MYFVTICTKNREPYFGHVDASQIENDMVEQNYTMVETQNFASLQNDSPFFMVDYTCMNITRLGKMAQQCWRNIPLHFSFVHLDAFVVMPDHLHGILIIDKPHHIQLDSKNTYGPQSANLASIIRGFKIGVTKFAHSCGYEFFWQSRFHDRILHKEKDLNAVRGYIARNPYVEECDAQTY